MPWNDATIIRVVQETPLDRTFHLELAGPTTFEAVPGQYVVVRDPAEAAPRDWYFSLSGVPGADGSLRVTVRGRGEAVQGIYDTPAGTRWQVQPPAGTFHVESPPGETLVLAAAGSGVTPFRTYLEQRVAALEQGAAPGDAVWLFHSARSPDELLFGAEFARWAEDQPSLHYVPTITGADEAWDGRRGRLDAEALEPALAEPARTRLYACGPGPFVEAALETAAALGLPEEHRLRERW